VQARSLRPGGYTASLEAQLLQKTSRNRLWRCAAIYPIIRTRKSACNMPAPLEQNNTSSRARFQRGEDNRIVGSGICDQRFLQMNDLQDAEAQFGRRSRGKKDQDTVQYYPGSWARRKKMRTGDGVIAR
jgi:hypothetical protein